MIDLDEVAARIKSRCPAFAGRVGLTSEFSEVTSTDIPGGDIQVPHAFVIPLYERGEERTDIQAAVQDERAYFAIAVCVDNTVQGGRGGASKSAASALSVLQEAKKQIARALLLWTPTDATGPVNFEQGFHMSMNNARLWHQFQWSAPDRLLGDISDATVPDENDPNAPSDVDIVLESVWPPTQATMDAHNVADVFALADQPDGHGQAPAPVTDDSAAEDAFLHGFEV